MDNQESKVVGVRFKEVGKIYYFDPDKMDIQPGEEVIVETVRGKEYGHVVVGPRWVQEKEVTQPLKKIIRRVTEEDRVQLVRNKEDEIEALDVCQRKTQEHHLPMKLVDVEYTFDRSKIIFYFTAEGRVDFRNLVKDLASIFRTRIELRQIGVRDEAKMIGGLGSCGRELCCATFLGDFETVSIKMAKEQNLSLNPNKISGICGRLMCCLKYENKNYEEQKKKMPRQGSRVKTPYGVGSVDNVNLLQELMIIKFADGKKEVVDLLNIERVDKETPLDPLQSKSPGPSQEIREAHEPVKRPNDKVTQKESKEQDKKPKDGRSKKNYRNKKKTSKIATSKTSEDNQAKNKPEADKAKTSNKKRRPNRKRIKKKDNDKPDRGKNENN